MQSFFYIRDSIEFLPLLSIPRDTRRVRNVHDEVDITVAARPKMDDTFMALSGFWVIMSEILHLYRGPKAPKYITLASPSAKYQKLLLWTDSLPKSMARGK
jgi:hypothetical protein